MSEPGFLKCSCAHCGGHIAFPEHGIGLSVNCPHCGQGTILTAPDAPPVAPPTKKITTRATAPGAPSATPAPVASAPPAAPPPPPAQPPPAPPQLPVEPQVGVARPASRGRLKKIGTIALVALVLIGLPIGKSYFKRLTRQAASDAVDAVTSKKVKEPEPEPEPPPPPRQPGEDLQMLRRKIQKAEEGSLRYVMGAVTNHAGKQFFNVKIEFEMLNAKKQVVGAASDYVGNLSAHGVWNFRAQILDKDATTARFGKLVGEKE
jgi:hypothetical protein